MTDADPIAATAAKIEEYLKDFGGTFSRVAQGVYFAKKGSALVGIRVVPWLADDALVHISANVVEGADLAASSGILRALLEYNHGSYHGAFGVSPDGMVTFHHALRGSTLDKGELIPAVVEVARVADDWDDQIIAEVGGKTAVARLREATAQPPGDAATG